jgi:hypothetical protein
MAFLSRDSQVGVSKSCQMGLPRLWSPITLWLDLGSQCNQKQSCSSCRELSNGISHAPCSQVNQVDSWLFVVGSQIGSLTPGPSFGRNLCFRCPNEHCEPILDIYVPRAFQWYKECHNPLSFDPCNRFLKFQESTRTPSPKVGVALGVWGFTPSYSLTLSNTPGSMWCDSWASSCLGLLLGPHPCGFFALTPGFPFALILGLPFGPQPYNPFALIASPKLGLQ